MASGIHELPAMAEPRMESFTEARMPDEPATDVKMTLESGVVLRERVFRIDHREGVTFGFTYTQLDADGKVITTKDGEPLIAPVHEVAFMGENANNVDINSALREGRKVGAARAADFFAGLDKLTEIMKDRLFPVPEAPQPPAPELNLDLAPQIAPAINFPATLPPDTELVAVERPVSGNPSEGLPEAP